MKINFKTPSFEKRYIFIFVVLLLMMGALSMRLFDITILQGDEYRDSSDTKRIKEVRKTAPRGNIYDRNGRLLAGTRTTFTVQLINDELQQISLEERNTYFLQLVRQLEEDGVSYQNEYDIELNVLRFTNDADWFTKEKTPTEMYAEALQKEGRVAELLRKIKTYPDKEHTRFAPVQLAIKALEQKGILLPIKTTIGDTLSLEYIDGSLYRESLEKYGLTENDPLNDVVRLIKDDESIIIKLLTHPVVRELAFEMLQKDPTVAGIELEDMMLVQDLRMLEIKSNLNETVPNITLETQAKDDFVAIADQMALETLLLSRYEEGAVVPVQLAIDALNRAGVDHDFSWEEHDGIIEVVYENPGANEGDALPALIKALREAKLVGPLVTSDALKAHVQEIILNQGLNPRILVSTWQYVYEKERQDTLEGLDLPANASVDAVYQARNKLYEIKHDSVYECIGVQSLHRQLEAIGHYGYEPLNIAYNLSDKTVAYLEEVIPNNKGVQISIEPVRYYPHGTLAAHVLGYVGRIATEEELAKYNETTGYLPGDIIGKTGVEEAYEHLLKGVDGKQTVQVDVLGNRTQTLDEIEPVPGNNIFLTIDYDLQRTLEDGLKKTLDNLQVGGSFESEWGTESLSRRSDGSFYSNATSGSSVAIDVSNGAILAMANYNPYDPNLFSTGISQTDWNSLFPEDERDLLAHRPLLNIATQSEIQPGSIFKMVTTYAAYNKGMPPGEAVFDSGYVTIGDTDFGCWLWNEQELTHGYVNMAQALMHSCNYYYYALALGENQSSHQATSVRLDIEDVEKAAMQFGLNEPTGIEIKTPQEASGQIPDPIGKLNSVRGMMRNFLSENLKDYLQPDTLKTEAAIEADQEKILTWLDEETLVERQEVSDRLSEMGYVAETPIEGNVTSLTDILKYTYVNQAGWDITDTLNVVIGQGQNAYTPLQMAHMTATIANNGNINKTSIFEKAMNFSNTSVVESPTRERRPIEGDRTAFPHIQEGMNMAANHGWIGTVFDKLPIEVATKTGTAQRAGINPVTGELYDDYGWFVSYAPYEHPEIAIATVLFQGGSGSSAGPMTREVYAKYFDLQPGVDTQGQTEEAPEGEYEE